MPLGHWLVNQLSKHLTKDQPRKCTYLCDSDRVAHEVRPADVLLVEGRNRISRMIQVMTHSAWTHAMLYIGRLHDIDDPQLRELVHKHYRGKLNEQLLIESILGKGTVITPFSAYRNEHIRICRPTGLSHDDAQQVIAHSVKSLGRKYSLRHIFDLFRFITMNRFLPGRWRSSLFEKTKHGKASQDICSAMIANAFASIHFPILPLVRETDKHKIELIARNPKLFTPSDFDYSPYFEIIKYPMFSLAKKAPYRELPWREGLISNDDIGITDDQK